ncbi:hypothetical protein CsSME_00053818 [Camellia sinensis var. sinensis]
MADDFSHDGAPPELPLVDFKADIEAEPEPLLLSVWPFDPVRFHPQTHILPTTGGIRCFTDFADDAPENLLLREPESHLSVISIEGESCAFRGYGAMTARDWYDELPAGVCNIVDDAGFSIFCSSLTRVTACHPLLGALVERWWDTTNSFYFSTTGEMMMTPYDFAMITGLGVGGDSIPLDPDMEECEATWLELLKAHPPIYRMGMVRYTWFEERFRGTEPETIKEIEHYARDFLMFIFGTTLFSNRWNTVGLYLLSALVTFPRVQFYDWGV